MSKLLAYSKDISTTLRIILNEMDSHIFTKDTSGRYTYVNNAVIQLFQHSYDDIIGKDDSYFFDLERANALRLNDRRVLYFGEIIECEEENIIKSSGEKKIYWTVKKPIHNTNNQIVGLWGVSTDITERVTAENELRIAATAFQSQEGIMITDAKGVILKVNNAFSAIYGYNETEIIGKTPQILSSGRHSAEFYLALWSNINNKGSWDGEIWNKRKNGEVFPVHLTITAVKATKNRIINYVGTLTDISAKKASDREIQYLAFYDPLTGLPNRRLLSDRLSRALASSGRSGSWGALMFLDLDHFKLLNDTRGHDLGDVLLKQVAERLTDSVRIDDTVARLGGDEFVLILENLSEQAFDAASRVEIIATKLLAMLNQPYELSAQPYYATSSIGITLFQGESQKIDDILKQADIAMYQAKKSGRNKIRFFDPQMQESINTRAYLEEELRNALNHQQFSLYYQLQINDKQQPLGAEALIRWLHPQRGLISPALFIPLAEETGLILAIGQWVLETVCALLKEWQNNERTRYLTLSVNVSAKQFHQTDFKQSVLDTVRRYAINPQLLKLELTESVLLDNIQETIETMHTLKNIGIQFSLDDFGTGYSSLQYLKKLPLDQLKIDQSFVKDIVENQSDLKIVGAIIAIAESLNLKIIAEGVEIKAQQQLLMDAGCNEFQGYFFSKPLPLAAFTKLLQID